MRAGIQTTTPPPLRCSAACRLVSEPPEVWEFTSYHARAGDMVAGEFLNGATAPRAAAFGLSGADRARKEAMFACYPSQRDMLRKFPIGVERFRPAPRYDFTLPPHSGQLFYEQFEWGMTGERFRATRTPGLGGVGDRRRDMKLSVLSVAYSLVPAGPDAAGGSEQILTLLDRTLVERGHRSVVVACEGSTVRGTLLASHLPPGTLDDEARTAQARQLHARNIAHALSTWHFDVIHMHSLDFHTYLPPAGTPLVATLHLPPDWYPQWIFRMERPQTWLHCVSGAQERGCPASPMLLPHIDNGVPLEALRTHVRKRDFALALGRICPEKGYHLALDAATRAHVPLLLAGEVFPYREHEEYFCKQILPRLNGSCRRFIGPVGLARKRRLLTAARCLLVPSLVQETSSLVSMEAMACGTPVIAFPSGALAEIVEHGRTGFLVNDEREMADAIAAVDSINPEECSRVARERFPAERMISRYLDMYQRMAGLSRPAEEELSYSAGDGCSL